MYLFIYMCIICNVSVYVYCHSKLEVWLYGEMCIRET